MLGDEVLDRRVDLAVIGACLRKLAAPQLNDPGYWHRRAEEARVLAEQMSDERDKDDALRSRTSRRACRQSGYMLHRRDKGELILQQCVTGAFWLLGVPH